MKRTTLLFLCSFCFVIATAQETVLVPPLGHAEFSKDANLEDKVVRNSKTIVFDSPQAWIGQVHALKRILILDALE